MYPKLNEQIELLTNQFGSIPNSRKDVLEKIGSYIANSYLSKVTASLVYICTHNSRRSHFGQIWAKTAAHYYNITNVETFSGGTEATAFNPNAIAAIKTLGFKVIKTTEESNSKFEVYFDEQMPPILCYSKKFDDQANPVSNFCAIMTCNEADEACPIVNGANLRVASPYEDPKAFDGTSLETLKYEERCLQIATEILYAFACASNQINSK